ncbi:MAG TPA: HlyD family efflux transporter periplasmic adaptor subunit [Candidatus Polarisedimenticolia bacterium]|jgi:HlyD family secretion protein|nr:HlyD family efflux transporter periplasmic adaptor subunit [Candidatus Polarisedimenticolia bacterium]
MTAALLLAGCAKDRGARLQGYVEGDFVHIAAPVAGRLEKVEVTKGQTIEAKAPLFELEADLETAAVKREEEAVRSAEARLADLQTGRRKVEQEVTRAQLDQAVAAEKQSAAALERDQAQFDVGGISRAALDESQAKHDVNAARVRELQGQVEVARLPARTEQIRAQSADAEAARAALAEARWRLDQKHVVATLGGLVFDTLFREGEWVPAGAPVIRLLPSANVKVRFYVPEPLTARYPLGQAIEVRCDGCAAPVQASVSYASVQPEYTPPVIYSDENRSKLVFLYEARPKDGAAASLRPGQPVEVTPR